MELLHHTCIFGNMAGVEFVSAPGIDELISMNDEVYRKAAELCNVHGK